MKRRLRERYPNEYANHAEKKRQKKIAAQIAQAEQKARLMIKSGAHRMPKPDNIDEIINEANNKNPLLNKVQVILEKKVVKKF